MTALSPAENSKGAKAKPHDDPVMDPGILKGEGGISTFHSCANTQVLCKDCCDIS